MGEITGQPNKFLLSLSTQLTAFLAMCAYTFNRLSQDGVDLVSGDVAAVSPADVLVDADDAEVGLDPAQEGDSRTAAVGRHTVHGVGLTGQ